MAIKYQQIDKQHILYQDTLETKVKEHIFDLSLFNPQKLLNEEKVYKEAKGRGKTYFFKQDQQNWVLRHYWRGGLIGKVMKDYYWWHSLKNTRPYQELLLLDIIDNLQLPGPKPIAARLSRNSFYYQADIITEAIDDSHSLVSLLQKPLDKSLWKSIGQTIARFHYHGIYHDDLNAHNILIKKNYDVYLIDFDKGKQLKSSATEWKQKNLDRLFRSLTKEKRLRKIKEFNQEDWLYLVDGYKQPIREI